MRPLKQLEMLTLMRDIANTDIRVPQGNSTSAVKYVNGLNARVNTAREFMTSLVNEEDAQRAYHNWIDVYKADARNEGWDIVASFDNFQEFRFIDTHTGRMSTTVAMYIRTGTGEHHSAAREFLHQYSPCVWEILEKAHAVAHERCFGKALNEPTWPHKDKPEIKPVDDPWRHSN